MEESVYKISSQVSTISRNQKYFRTRENRNFDTVRNTEGRIVNFSLIQSGLVVCMGALQVFVVRFFFQVRAYPTYKYAELLSSTNVLSRARARDMYKRQLRVSNFYALGRTAMALVSTNFRIHIKADYYVLPN